jgi:hypothetical protein
MDVDSSDPSGVLDERTAPFTFGELVAADLILGLTEQQAAASWRLAFETMRRLRREQAAHPDDPDRHYEITLRDANLAALSLLSSDIAARVDRLRRGNRPELIEDWRRNRSDQEFAESMRELEEEDSRWEALKLEVSQMAREREGET